MRFVHANVDYYSNQTETNLLSKTTVIIQINKAKLIFRVIDFNVSINLMSLVRTIIECTRETNANVLISHRTSICYDTQTNIFAPTIKSLSYILEVQNTSCTDTIILLMY